MALLLAQIAEGAPYAVVSPELTRLAPDVAVVEGTMGTKDVSAEVTYAEAKVTITFFYRENASSKAKTVTHDMQLKARWSRAGRVIFDSKNGQGGMANQFGLPGETIMLNPNSFTKPGYRFAGWNTKRNGTGNAYKDKAQFTITSTGDVTLYAQWVQEKAGELKLTKIETISKRGKLILTAKVMDGDKPVKGAVVKFTLLLWSQSKKTDKNGFVQYNFDRLVDRSLLTVGKTVKYSATYAGETVSYRALVVE